jgi:hypothetical protein
MFVVDSSPRSLFLLRYLGNARPLPLVHIEITEIATRPDLAIGSKSNIFCKKERKMRRAKSQVAGVFVYVIS